jgi:hypothetical protein
VAARPLFDPSSTEARGQQQAIREVRELVGGGGAAGRAAEVAMALVGG